MKLHNVLTPTKRGRTQTASGTNYLDTLGRHAVHWGIDLRPTTAGEAGDRVVAPCRATVISVGRGDGSQDARIPYHSGKFAYLHLGVWGGDHMYLYVGHLDSVSVKTGETLEPGELIGIMGGTGATRDNQFGVHAHIGVAQNTNRPESTLRNGQGWIDPVAWFAKHGVNFNTTPTAPTQEEFTVSQVQEIINGVAAITAPVQRSGKTVNRKVTTLMSSHDNALNALTGIVRELATRQGMTPEQVEDAAKRGAAEAIDEAREGQG